MPGAVGTVAWYDNGGAAPVNLEGFAAPAGSTAGRPTPPAPPNRPSATVVDPLMRLPDYFLLSNNSGIYQDSQTSTGWTGFSQVPGGTGDNGFVSAPAAVTYNGKVEVFAVSSNGSVYQNTKTGSTWTGWDKASLYTGTGNAGFVGTPAAVVDPATGLPIFIVRSNFAALYEDALTSTGWTGFAALAGGTGNAGFSDDAGAVAYGNSVDVYAVSNNNSVYHDLKTGSSWTGWNKDSLYTGTGNTGFRGVPAASVNATVNLPGLIVTSTNSSVYMDRDNGAGWDGFSSTVLGAGNTGFVTQ